MLAPLSANLVFNLITGALVAVFAGIAVTLVAGRRRGDGPLARLHRMIAKPAPSPAIDLHPPGALPPPSEAAGLPPTRRPASASQATAVTADAPAQPAARETDASQAVSAPAIPGGRVAEATLAPLAERVDRSRRIGTCEARVASKLMELPHDRWVVDSYVLVGGHRVPFVLLGETGVFGIWPLDGASHPRDPEHFDDAAKVIQGLLPDYRGEVQVGICRPMDPGMQPRWHIAPPAQVGAWVMGLDWLIPWIEHFGTEHGLGVDDVARFNALAGPHWKRRITGVPLPSQPGSG